ncbi:MAG: patatin-like phospholipase family protein [Caldiserica bacterium]|nr:patatin-like phospholipase family protein [Caldisericota bacterium]MDH7562231.1 patatin-like phospholipase family protein [Caldisericota bacterium]
MGNFKKIGLALGSGGAKGLAHIGVLKALERAKIPVEFIAGSSIGALIGGLYACWMDAKKLEELASSVKWRELLSLVDPALRKGLIRGKRISRFLERLLGPREFKDLSTPFKAVATDLLTGERVVIDDGEVAIAIRASGAYPLVFQPVEWRGRLLVDGGLSAPVPAEIVREMGAEVVLAVNLDSEHFSFEVRPGSLSYRRIMSNSINALRYHLARENVRWADLVICPRVGVVGWDKFLEPEELIPKGEEAMEEKLPHLLSLLKG